MGVVHVPRVLASLARGFVRRSTPLDKTLALASPHVAQRRAGLFDLDLHGHMNNAGSRLRIALLLIACPHSTHLSAQCGFFEWSVRKRAAFIIGGLYLRFRKEIMPFQRFEVHSQFSAFDERWIYISQTMQPSGGGEVLAQSFCRAVIKQGRKSISPRDALESHGVEAATILKIGDPQNLELHRSSFVALDDAVKSRHG
ncbi:MAG: hypothetical protein SGPRY_006790 [Prymnesium sp.]